MTALQSPSLFQPPWLCPSGSPAWCALSQVPAIEVLSIPPNCSPSRALSGIHAPSALGSEVEGLTESFDSSGSRTCDETHNRSLADSAGWASRGMLAGGCSSAKPHPLCWKGFPWPLPSPALLAAGSDFTEQNREGVLLSCGWEAEAHTDIRGALRASWRVGKFLGGSPDPNSSLGTGPVDDSCQWKQKDFHLSTV